MKKGRLKVVENEMAYEVVYEDSDQRSVAQFDKSWPEAKAWAQHMVDEYNDWRSAYLGG